MKKFNVLNPLYDCVCGEKVGSKAILAAVFAASAFSLMPVGAEEVVTLDLSDKPQNQPTLDYLKENNILIPQKGEWDSSTQTWGEAAPIQSPGSGYHLTKVDADGRNVLQKYEFNKETGQLEPVYYQVDLNKTVYGEGDQTKYFEWLENSYGQNVLSEVSVPAEGNTTIEYHYSVNNLQERISNSKGNDYGYIAGDFVGNTTGTEGGAINNDDSSIIGDITGNFVGNTADSYGGAIYNDNSSIIGNITGNFVGNTADSYGGAIYNDNSSIIGDITGNFVGNTAGSYGGVIYNAHLSTIGNITGDFIGNTAVLSSCGAIVNHATIGDITGDFIGNTANTSGGAIYNDRTIGNITGNFVGNTVAISSGGAIYNYEGTIGDITANFIGNSANSCGGAIHNDLASIGAKDSEGNVIGGIINSNFYGNHVNPEYYFMQGGAIWTNSDLNIIADTGSSTFSGNYVQMDDGTKNYQAIYVDQAWNGYMATLNFISRNNGAINMYDSINGIFGYTYTVNITGDNTGVFNLYNDIYNANVQLGNTTLGTINNDIHTYNFKGFTLTNNAKMTVDVDLASPTMDRISAKDYGEHRGDLIVSGMNLLSDLKEGENSASILFAEKGLKDHVGGALALPDNNQTTVYTPIYKYDVSYDNREDAGYFVFNRGGLNTGNVSDNFNPAVLSTPVANQSGSQSVINETVRFAFQHMDMFSQLPASQRMALINENKYAITEGKTPYNSDFERLDKGFWVKPFTSFESINLDNGPKVDAITYGTLFGHDGKFRELKRGWYNVQSLYGGYNGSQMSYSGVDTSLNGGVLGLTETFYKGNFFTALTGTAGANVGTSSTMHGNEDFTSLIGGIGTKSGYNFEFKNGKYIVQPIMFMNYSFVNTFDYTNAAGVKIKSDPLHTFQINPQIKAVANLKNGWQPYASVGVVWNVLNSTKVRADNVILPKMSVDPYVEYGVGVQKLWKDKFTGFAQAMVRNGGRNGVALTFGFRWAIGKDTSDL